MRNFFRRLRESFSNSKKARETRNKKMREAKAELDKGNVTPRTGFDAVRADVAMDFGAAEKDTEYFSRLGKRQERSQQALADMRDKRRKRNDEKAEAAADTTATDKTEEVTNVTETAETDDTTVLDPTTDTALDTVEDISTRTFDNTNNITNYFDDTATSVATAAGQEQNQASALTTSVGEAEDDAISMMTTGTLSNIKTTPQGLLTDEDDEADLFRRRRTLIGA